MDCGSKVAWPGCSEKDPQVPGPVLEPGQDKSNLEPQFRLTVYETPSLPRQKKASRKNASPCVFEKAQLKFCYCPWSGAEVTPNTQDANCPGYRRVLHRSRLKGSQTKKKSQLLPNATCSGFKGSRVPRKEALNPEKFWEQHQRWGQGEGLGEPYSPEAGTVIKEFSERRRPHKASGRGEDTKRTGNTGRT